MIKYDVASLELQEPVNFTNPRMRHIRWVSNISIMLFEWVKGEKNEWSFLMAPFSSRFFPLFLASK